MMEEEAFMGSGTHQAGMLILQHVQAPLSSHSLESEGMGWHGLAWAGMVLSVLLQACCSNSSAQWSKKGRYRWLVGERELLVEGAERAERAESFVGADALSPPPLSVAVAVSPRATSIILDKP